MQFSIIIVTYNQQLEKTLLTIKSILNQTFDDYEIVLTDEGSEYNYFEEIRNFFENEGFYRYKLLSHEKNQGTVCNLISALEHAEGTYVKDFGSGDMFYDPYSLEKLYQYLYKKECDVCMGAYKAYYWNSEGMVSYKSYLFPLDIDAYKRGDSKRIQKNLILYGDRIPGVCLAYKKEFFLEYMNRIKNSVIYLEDIFEVLSSLNGTDVKLFDEYLFLYEVNVGISSAKNKEFEDMLNRDIDNFYKMLEEQYPDLELLKKRRKLLFLYKIDNLYLRTLIRLFVNPGALGHIFWFMVHKITNKSDNKQSFLDSGMEYRITG